MRKYCPFEVLLLEYPRCGIHTIILLYRYNHTQPLYSAVIGPDTLWLAEKRFSTWICMSCGSWNVRNSVALSKVSFKGERLVFHVQDNRHINEATWLIHWQISFLSPPSVSVAATRFCCTCFHKVFATWQWNQFSIKAPQGFMSSCSVWLSKRCGGWKEGFFDRTHWIVRSSLEPVHPLTSATQRSNRKTISYVKKALSAILKGESDRFAWSADIDLSCF